MGNQALSPNGTAAGRGDPHQALRRLISVTDCSFLDNTASSVGGSTGGAIALDSLLQGTITGCQFTGNQAHRHLDGTDGGAVANTSKGKPPDDHRQPVLE